MTSHFTLQARPCDSGRRDVGRRRRLTGPLRSVRSVAWALEWHRITRRIDAEHAAGTREQMDRLIGTALDSVLSTPGTLSVRLGGRSVTMNVTDPGTAGALTRAGDQAARVLLADAGRYGRFWWMAFDTGAGDAAARIVVLARRVVVAADPDAGGSRHRHLVTPSRV